MFRFLFCACVLECDLVLPHLHPGSADPEGPPTALKRSTLMVLAVTLHNIPEGMAVGLSFVMISGGMDLSLGWQMSLVGVTTAVLMKNMGLPVWLSLVLCGLCGVALGLFNGVMTVSLKVHPLIVTLGTMTIFQGLSYTVANQSVILNLPQSYKFFGQGYLFGWMPVSVILMAVVVAAASFILNKTYFGRHIYAVGSNEDAAHLAGIKVKKIKLLVFSLCGFFVSIATTILFARTGSAAPATGPGVEFNCMTAAVLGGISFKGGDGKMWGLVTGVLILGILGNGMQLVGLNTYVQYIVKGAVLLAAFHTQYNLIGAMDLPARLFSALTPIKRRRRRKSKGRRDNGKT